MPQNNTQFKKPSVAFKFCVEDFKKDSFFDVFSILFLVYVLDN